MTSLLLAGLFFVAVHIGIAGTTLRDHLDLPRPQNRFFTGIQEAAD